MWMGIASPWSSTSPLESHRAVEKSKACVVVGDRPVLCTVSIISSEMDWRAFRMTSKVTGSKAVLFHHYLLPS